MKNIKTIIAISSLLIFSNTYCKETKKETREEAFQRAKKGGNGLIFVESDLSNLRSKEYNLTEANLVEADLTKANLRNSKLDRAILNGATMVDTQLQRANLTGAQLQKAILNQAQLNQAFLQGANFAGANLTNADFSNYDSRNMLSRIKDFYFLFKNDSRSIASQIASQIKNAYVLLRNFKTILNVYSKYPNQMNANFAQARAINTKFINANLINTNFQGANLSGAKFNDSILAFANFSNVQSLDGTDFSGAILLGAKFDNTDFEGAIVKDVDFFGVDLTEKQKKCVMKNGGIIDPVKTNKHDIRNFFKPSAQNS
jgi:uncharacterized protein YjbI with pentapeptide repeats